MIIFYTVVTTNNFNRKRCGVRSKCHDDFTIRVTALNEVLTLSDTIQSE